MAKFKYIAIDQLGKSVSGEVEARDQIAAKKQVRAEGLTPLKFTEGGGGGVQVRKKTAKAIPFGQNDSAGKIASRKFSSTGEKTGLEFMKRLLELNSSGMPVADAVKLLNLRLSDPKQKTIAASLWKELSEGRTLSRAMRSLPQNFEESSTYVIEAGEATGNISPILQKIIAQIEEKRGVRSTVLSGLSYPAFVCSIAFGVVLFFLFGLLPQMQDLLTSLNGPDAQPNLLARILIGGGETILLIGPFLLGALSLGAIVTLRWSKSDSGRFIIDRMLLKLPLVGRIVFLSELFQLSNLLATLISSGVGLTENLRLCEKTIRNSFLRANFRSARGLVNEGKSLPEALRRFKFMPLMQLDVLEIGEKTGNLANSMQDVANAFRGELTKRIKKMTTLVSGLALGLAFSLVALVAIAIVTSISDVTKSIN